MLTYLHTLRTSARCKKNTVTAISLLLLIMIPLFTLTSLVYVFISRDYGANNVLDKYSVGYRFILIIFYFIIGFLLHK